MSTGQIKWRTCFSSVSYYGYKLDILKSALQKYLRRREEEKMLWCLGEIYLFHVMAKTEYEIKATKGIISNMLNRIIIMMDEELLFTEWEKYLLCRELIEKFEASGRGDFKALIAVCKILVGAELLRLNSDISGYFWRGMKFWGIPPPAAIHTVLEETPFASSKAIKTVLQLKKPGDTLDNVLLMANFIAYFEKADPKCFYWAFQLFEKAKRKEKGGTRFRRKGCEYILWEYLLQQCGDNSSLKKCVEYRLKEFFVLNRGERHIWQSSAIMLVMYKNRINWTKQNMTLPICDDDIKAIYKNRSKLVIDDYAIDMHCSAGRRKGKNKVDFIVSGAVVENENKEWFVQEWRDVYNGGKIKSFNASVKRKKKSKELNKIRFDDLEKGLPFIDFSAFTELSPCMKTTCGGKAMCLYATYEGRKVVLKEARPTLGYYRDYMMIDNLKELFGLKKIGMFRIRTNKIAVKIDRTQKYWENNWQLEDGTDIVYVVMERIKDAQELQQRKDVMQDNKTMLKEFIKIGLFRGIFRVTDFNPRNVLVDRNNDLFSIDEGSMGQREKIIGHNNVRFIKKYATEAFIREILSEINSNKQKKKEAIAKEMSAYKFSGTKIKEVFEWYNRLENNLIQEKLLQN